MLNINTLARPYAKAAFEFASAAGQEDGWATMLLLASGLVETPEVIQQLSNPSLNKQAKVEFLLQLCQQEASKEFANFLQILGENGRLSLLPIINELFIALVAEKNRAVEVEVQSAFELSANQLKTLAAALSKRLDRTVQPKATVNPALIGGLFIRAGDLVIDGSVRGKLDKLAEALKS